MTPSAAAGVDGRLISHTEEAKSGRSYRGRVVAAAFVWRPASCRQDAASYRWRRRARGRPSSQDSVHLPLVAMRETGGRLLLALDAARSIIFGGFGAKCACECHGILAPAPINRRMLIAASEEAQRPVDSQRWRCAHHHHCFNAATMACRMHRDMASLDAIMKRCFPVVIRRQNF